VPIHCRFSIIIPVLHEAKLINEQLERVRQLQTDQPFEIIVVDGSSTRDTLQVISDATVGKYACPPGRGRQMNEGAAHANGDILVFLHVDTTIPSNGLLLIDKTLEDDRYAGGAFTLRIQSNNPLLRMMAVATTLRSRLTRAPYGDQVHFVRKSYFDAIGGYKDIPLMEDVELMRRIYKEKGKIIILPTSVVTSDRRWKQEGVIYASLRDTLIIFLYWCGMPAEKLAKFYPWQTIE
jgi:rSAM/selenodomain-associated transferase 2